MNLTTSLNELNESEIVSITRDIAHTLVNVTTTAEGPIFAQHIDLAVNIINTLNRYEHLTTTCDYHAAILTICKVLQKQILAA